MKTIKKAAPLRRYRSRSFDTYWEDSTLAVFDLETTGLSPKSSTIILSGILLLQADSLEGDTPAEAFQFFAQDPSEEREVIQNTLEVLQRADVLVTYNGQTFDLPFLKDRAKKCGCTDASILEEKAHLDLFQIISRYSDLRALIGSLTQKNLEVYMGFGSKRKDQISGGESVKRYMQYLLTKDATLEDEILLHNYDDIFQLARLLSATKYSDFHKAMYEQGFLAGENARYRITEIKLRKQELYVSALVSDQPADYIRFPSSEAPYWIQASRMDGSDSFGRLDLTFPVQEATKGTLVMDAASCLSQDSYLPLAAYPNFESGYLILKQDDRIHYLSINIFLLSFLHDLNLDTL